MRYVTPLILMAPLLVSCVFEEPETAPPRNYYEPPRFLLDRAALTDTLVVGDTVRVALNAIGDSVILSTSGPDARVVGDTLHWFARLNDTGLNIIIVYATDRRGAKDSAELHYFVRRFGGYHPIVEIKEGMEWEYESYHCESDAPICGRDLPRPWNTADTIHFYAKSVDSISAYRSSDGMRLPSNDLWDWGLDDSVPKKEFGYFEKIPACADENVTYKVDSVRFDQNLRIIRTVLLKGSGCLEYEPRKNYYIPEIGLVYSSREIYGPSLHSGLYILLDIKEFKLIKFGDRQVDFRAYVDSVNARLPSAF